jgi:hypothetical protein
MIAEPMLAPSGIREHIMHAALIRLTIDPAQAPIAAATFTKDLLPAVKAAEGFIAGYWLDPVDGEGFGFVLFDTEEQARKAALPASRWSAPGVTVRGVEIRRVAAGVS